MATNQFKVHGQLPLHGMTVSAVPLDSTHVRQAAPEDEPPKEAQLSLCQRPPLPSPPRQHTYRDNYTSSPLHLLFLASLRLSILVLAVLDTAAVWCFSRVSVDQREWRWVGGAARLHAGGKAAVGGGGSEVRTAGP